MRDPKLIPRISGDVGSALIADLLVVVFPLAVTVVGALFKGGLAEVASSSELSFAAVALGCQTLRSIFRAAVAAGHHLSDERLWLTAVLVIIFGITAPALVLGATITGTMPHGGPIQIIVFIVSLVIFFLAYPAEILARAPGAIPEMKRQAKERSSRARG
jgi:hypothetical protein